MDQGSGSVVITGASSGIGAEMARLWAAEGRPLVLVARRTERLDALKAELGRDGLPVEVVTSDLLRPDAPGELVQEIARRGITVHTLVNNAGFGLRGRFLDLSEEEQLAIVQLNVVALTRLCRLVLPGLVARRAGGILNVASTAAFQPIPGFAVYAASKAFVLALSEALHEEVRGHGVTVTAFCPGPTATEFASRANMENSWLFRQSADAVAVARAGIEGFKAGRAVVIPGSKNRLGAALTRFVPRSLARRVAGRLQR